MVPVLERELGVVLETGFTPGFEAAFGTALGIAFFAGFEFLPAVDPPWTLFSFGVAEEAREGGFRFVTAGS